MLFQLPRSILLLTLAGLLPASAVSSEMEKSAILETVKRTSDQWLQLEQRLVEQKNQWRSDKEILKHSIFILGKLKEELAVTIEEKEARSKSLQDALSQTDAQLAQQQAGSARLRQSLDHLETRIRRLAEFAPPPLEEKISPHLQRLADLQEDSAARIQSLLTVLTFLEQFNNAFTLTNSIRQLENGDSREVKTLYCGLAFAYATTTSQEASQAWILLPAQGEWIWSEADAHATSIAQTIAVYEKAAAPQLVDAPVILSALRPSR